MKERRSGSVSLTPLNLHAHFSHHGQTSVALSRLHTALGGALRHTTHLTKLRLSSKASSFRAGHSTSAKPAIRRASKAIYFLFRTKNKGPMRASEVMQSPRARVAGGRNTAQYPRLVRLGYVLRPSGGAPRPISTLPAAALFVLALSSWRSGLGEGRRCGDGEMRCSYCSSGGGPSLRWAHAVIRLSAEAPLRCSKHWRKGASSPMSRGNVCGMPPFIAKSLRTPCSL